MHAPTPEARRMWPRSPSRPSLMSMALCATPVTRIGRIEAVPGLRLIDAHGQPLAQPHYASFDHFA